jgi:prohibitin 1
VTIVIGPNFRSVMRAVTAAHTASALYSEGRETVARQMLDHMQQALTPRGIVVENVLLRDIVLPDTLRQAIEAKQQADQEAQRMNFVLLREKQEAERKRIEAQGIADFQRIVAQGISQQLLEWKGIEATMEVAKSPAAVSQGQIDAVALSDEPRRGDLGLPNPAGVARHPLFEGQRMRR